jgi:hypothetical protein
MEDVDMQAHTRRDYAEKKPKAANGVQDVVARDFTERLAGHQRDTEFVDKLAEEVAS